MNFQKANETIHKVEDQWHYRLMVEYGFTPTTKEATGFVRRYVYTKDDHKVICVTGASSDYWQGDGESGYYGTLEAYLKTK